MGGPLRGGSCSDQPRHDGQALRVRPWRTAGWSAAFEGRRTDRPGWGGSAMRYGSRPGRLRATSRSRGQLPGCNRPGRPVHQPAEHLSREIEPRSCLWRMGIGSSVHGAPSRPRFGAPAMQAQIGFDAWEEYHRGRKPIPALSPAGAPRRPPPCAGARPPRARSWGAARASSQDDRGGRGRGPQRSRLGMNRHGCSFRLLPDQRVASMSAKAGGRRDCGRDRGLQ